MIAIELFKHASNSIPFRAGDSIFRVGDPPDCMYVVLEGEVRISSNGRLLEDLGPGGVFGEIALIDNAPRSADAVATTDCRVVPISESHFQYLVQETPFFSLQVMRVMAERLRRTMAA